MIIVAFERCDTYRFAAQVLMNLLFNRGKKPTKVEVEAL